MLFWKLIVALDLLIAGGYARALWKGNEQLDALDFIDIPVALIGSVGLIIYAFALPAGPQVIWRVFLPIFIVWSAWEIARAANKDPVGAETIFGVLPALLLVGFTSVALYRLGGAHLIDAGGS